MKKYPILTVLAVVLALGFGGIAGFLMMSRLLDVFSDGDIRLLVGVAVTVFLFVVVSRTLIAWDMARSRLKNQDLHQAELERVSLLASWMKFLTPQRGPTINVRQPQSGGFGHTVEQHYLPPGAYYPALPGWGAGGGGAQPPHQANGQGHAMPPGQAPGQANGQADQGAYRDSLEME